jgi:hypothetical protein
MLLRSYEQFWASTANHRHGVSWHDSQIQHTGDTMPGPFQHAILSRRKNFPIRWNRHTIILCTRLANTASVKRIMWRMGMIWNFQFTILTLTARSLQKLSSSSQSARFMNYYDFLNKSENKYLKDITIFKLTLLLLQCVVHTTTYDQIFPFQNELSACHSFFCSYFCNASDIRTICYSFLCHKVL